MHDVHLRSVDLNLLRALDALLAECHVTRAAERIGLSQSAMSHALGRLRAIFSDPLLVRSAHGMQPTERALGLAAPLRAALEQLDGLLRAGPSFDPASTRRTFAIGASDLEELVVVRPLLARLRRDAPYFDVRLTAPLPARAAELLTTGALDLVLKPLQKRDEVEGIIRRRLLRDRFVVVGRRGNPHFAGRLTLRRYAAAPHALVAPGGNPRGIVDDLLDKRGLRRRIVVSLPHFLAVPHLLADTDLLVTLAARVAATFVPLLGLEARPLPLPLGPFAIDALWHARSSADPAHRYLRELVQEVTAAADPDP